MKIGSLFSGIGGLEQGLERAGLGETIWQVEQNPFCRKVLAKHWPGIERHNDVKEVGTHNLAAVDLLCGGFPCQDISSAGKGEGLTGSRSGLWFEYARIIEELAPEWVVVENVASGARRWVDQVQAHLGQLGYETIPIPISAEAVGAPHLRRRIFLIAHAAEDRRKERQSCGPTQEVTTASRSGASGPSAHAERKQLRQQPRRRSGANREGAPLTSEPSEAGSSAHADCESESEPVGAEYEKMGWVQDFTEDGGWNWRAPCSPVCRSDDASANRMDRLRALGNSVVPQCAETIGWMIRELINT